MAARAGAPATVVAIGGAVVVAVVAAIAEACDSGTNANTAVRPVEWLAGWLAHSRLLASLFPSFSPQPKPQPMSLSHPTKQGAYCSATATAAAAAVRPRGASLSAWLASMKSKPKPCRWCLSDGRGDNEQASECKKRHGTQANKPTSSKPHHIISVE